MTLLIGIDTRTPFHMANADSGQGPCAFTANSLGYQTLMKWAKAVAKGERTVFVVPGLAGYGRRLVEWLTDRGEWVVLTPVKNNCLAH